MADPLPRRFGKYVLQRRLGVGGMAETFVARRDDSVEQLVCVKRVLPAFNTDKDFIKQFVREARVAAKLRHSNIVGILDFGEVESEHYMALELVDGVDMRGLLHMEPDQQLDPELAVLIAIQIAYALEHAHASEGGIVHRDVTPSNILLSTHGEVKLADFGVAKALTGTSVATATGFIKGKVPYMAPEQMRGADIDGRVDLFSLGVTLFEALSGRRPFVGKHDVEVMMKVLESDRPALKDVAPALPEGLADVVEKLLAAKPEERFDEAGELVDALAPFVGNEEQARDRLAAKVVAAYGADTGEELATQDTELALQLPQQVADPEVPKTAPDTAPVEMVTAASEPLSRRRTPWIAAGAVVVALVAGVGAFALQSDDPVEPPLVNTDAVDVNTEMSSEMSVPTMETLPVGQLPPEDLPTEMTSTMTTMTESTMTESMTESTRVESEMESEMESMRRGTGMVRIRISPWGYIWHRGMRQRAPRTYTLPVGRHRFGIGQESVVQNRTVQIEANKTQQILVNLDE